MSSIGQAPSRVPKDGILRDNFSKTTPLSWHPMINLMPMRHGNPSRQFMEQDLFELTAHNKAVFAPLLTYNIYTINVDVLTAHCWPKVRLPEGVHRVTGTTISYNVQPATSVPKLGHVRFMSKETSSFSLSIAQKGIGSIYEGSALASSQGPALIAMDIRAFAESMTQAMAMGTALGIVNAAHRAPYLQPGSTYARTYSLQMAMEVSRWACIGLSTGRIYNELEEMLQENDRLDTLLIPDKAARYFSHHSSTEKVIYSYAIDRSSKLIKTESPDRLKTRGSILGGRVDVFDMTPFKMRNGRTMQVLETINTIGEVYYMYPEMSTTIAHTVAQGGYDIYLYDQPGDRFTKIKFIDALANCRIWSRKHDGKSIYDPLLINHVAEINEASKGKIDARQTFQMPISLDLTSKTVYLPRMFGNLDVKYMNPDDIHATVMSAVPKITHIVNGRPALLSDQHEEFHNIERLRELIERETYDPKYWERVARQNIARSVKSLPDGTAYFKGTLTSQARCIANNTQAIAEWTCNTFGGMDIPKDHAAGCFTAAGLQTIASTRDHPYRDMADRAYNFLHVLGRTVHNVFASSAIFSATEMPVNMPRNEMAQIVMTALYGPRVPVFLAAPQKLIDSAIKKASSSSSDIPPFEGTSGMPIRGIVGLQNLPRDFRAIPESGIFQLPGNTTVIVASDGVLIHLTKEEVVDLIKAKSPITATTIIAAIAGISAAKVSNIFERAFEREAQKVINLFAHALYSANVDTFSDVARHIYNLVLAIDKEDRAVIEALAGGIKPTQKKKKNWFFDIHVGSDSGVDVNLDRLQKLLNSGPPPEDVLTEPLRSLLDFTRETALKQDVSKTYITADDTLARILNQAGYDPFETKLDEEHRTRFSALLSEVFNEEREARGNVGIVPPSGPQPSSARSDDLSIGPLDIASANYYRCPMMCPWALIVSLARESTPWILPGDIKKRFETPIRHDDPRFENLNTEAWQYPHIVHSQFDMMRAPRNWSDVSIYYRIGMLSGAYVGNTRRGGRPVLSAGVLGRQLGHESEEAMDLDADPYPSHISSGLSVEDIPEEKFRELLRGPMTEHIKLVSARYSSLPVHRLIAYAFLNTELSLPSIIDLVAHNVWLPLEVLLWRLFSQTRMGTLIFMVSGPESGANFYNGARYTVSHDGDRDEWHSRAVLHTDAHPVKPENHLMLKNVQPRGYVRGHCCRFVEDPANLSEDVPAKSRPSIIATLVPRRFHENVQTPLSFVNRVPGVVIPGEREWIPVDPERQYFPGAEYYGQKVYGAIFNTNQIQTAFHVTPNIKDLEFEKDSKQPNHLAFRGYTIRIEPHTLIFSREFPGDGHRAPIGLNHPGAAQYLAGHVDYLDAPRPIANYSLY